MKKVLAAILFAVLILIACGEKEISEEVFIGEIEIKEGLMLADLINAGWRYDTAYHEDPDFLQNPVMGGSEIEIKMIFGEGNSSVVLFSENKTAGRIVLKDCPVSRFEIYSGDIGDSLTLPGGVTFGDNKNKIINKLGAPATKSDYAISYDKIPGIKELTFIMKDDQKTLDRIDIFI